MYEYIRLPCLQFNIGIDCSQVLQMSQKRLRKRTLHVNLRKPSKMKILLMYINTDIIIGKWFWIPYTNSNAQYVDIISMIRNEVFLTNSVFVLKLSVKGT